LVAAAAVGAAVVADPVVVAVGATVVGLLDEWVDPQAAPARARAATPAVRATPLRRRGLGNWAKGVLLYFVRHIDDVTVVNHDVGRQLPPVGRTSTFR
jgi:hypothetical protein